jgi:hypothetical protein
VQCHIAQNQRRIIHDHPDTSHSPGSTHSCLYFSEFVTKFENILEHESGA